MWMKGMKEGMESTINDKKLVQEWITNWMNEWMNEHTSSRNNLIIY